MQDPAPRAPQPAPPVAPGRMLPALLVAALVLAANFPVLGFEWLMFDDDINILVNPFLGRSALDSVSWAFQDAHYMRRYLPLGWLGFHGLLAIDGYNSTIFHAANWLLSGLNAALVFLVFEKLCRSTLASIESRPTAWQRIAASLLGAAAWSLHPLRAENVGWISGFLYLASTTFAALAVLLYLRVPDPGEHSAVRSRLASLAAAVLFLASLLVYPVFLALPAVLVSHAALVSTMPLRGAALALRRTAIWWLAAAVVVAVNIFARLTRAAHFSENTVFAPKGVGERLWDAVTGVLHYLGRTVWPGDVSPYYGPTSQLLAPVSQRIALLAVAAVLFFLVLRRATRRATLGWLAAAVLTLAPFLAQWGGDFHASDRYAVLWLGVCAATAALVLARVPRSASPAAFTAGLGAVAALAFGYVRALPAWQNTATLQHKIDRVTAAHPHVDMSFGRAARVFWWLGDQGESARRLREGQARFPGAQPLAATETQLAQLNEWWHRRVGTRLHIPPLAVQHLDLGRKWQQRGEPRAAAAHYARALVLAPDFSEAARGYLETSGATP